MTENRCIEVLKKMKHMFTETCAKIDENTALNMAIEAVKENQQYKAIGTIDEFKALKENQRKCEDCAGCTEWKCDCANIRAEAIDEAIEASAKAICVGCGYLDGYKCTYKGGNCGVSKPMLESVTKALEQLKGGAV